MVVGSLGGFVLGLVNAFKREPSPALILAYAGLEGLFVGGLPVILEAQFPGIALQAVLGTLYGLRCHTAAVQEREGPRHPEGHEVLHDRHQATRRSPWSTWVMMLIGR